MTPKWFIRRSALVVCVHLAAFATAYWAAFALRFDFPFPPKEALLFWISLPGILIVKSIVFYLLGQYRLSWRSVTFSDLASLLKASTVALLVVAAMYFVSDVHRSIGRSIPILDWGLTILILGGLRASYRLSREEFRWSYHHTDARRALILGANASGQALARHLYTEARSKYLVLGFLDADPALHGALLGGLPVLGAPERATQIAVRLNVQELLVRTGSLTGKQLRQLMEQSHELGIGVKVIPVMEDLLAGDYSMQIRDVDINDLLRREPVQLSSDAILNL